MSTFSITNSSSSLVSLHLSSNLLKSSSIFYWLFNSTTNLRTLYLGYNVLEGPIPDVFGKVMKSLEILDLYDNKLQGEIPSFFGNMCALQKLYLSENKLSGDISTFFLNSAWCNRLVFQSLYLFNNQITYLQALDCYLSWRICTWIEIICRMTSPNPISPIHPN